MIPQKLRKKLLEVDDAKTYPKWFKKVLARRLLLMLIPARLSRNLPRWLSRPIFGDNSVYPADAPWPDWFVIPPDFIWPDEWLPWILFEVPPDVVLETVFPPDWTPGDPLPAGVTLPAGYSLPATWTPYNPLPPGITAPPGFRFPPGWRAGDSLPAGVTLAPGASFPPRWTTGSSLPSGVTLAPGASFPPGWNAGDPVPDGVSVEPGAEFPPGWTPTDIPPTWIFQDPAQWEGDYDGAPPPQYTWIDPHGPTRKTRTDGELPSTTVHIFDTGNEEIRGGSDLSWDIAHDNVNGFIFHSTPPWGLAAFIEHYFAPYEVFRSLWKFDLAVIPAGKHIEAGQFWIWGSDFLPGEICAQKAPGALWNTASDFSKGEGDATLPQAYKIGKVIINLNDTILDYLNLNIGGTVYVMLKDYDCDYLDLAPGPGDELGMSFQYSFVDPYPSNPRLVLRYR